MMNQGVVMAQALKNASEKTGLPPGALVHVGEKMDERPKITIIEIGPDKTRKQSAETIEELLQYKGRKTVSWVNIEGLHDVELIAEIERHFNIHPLVLEDILNTHQRPKFEEFEDFLFVVLKGLTFDDVDLKIRYEQISIVILDGMVITFKEKADDLFAPVDHQLLNGKGRFGKKGADYLAYTLLDAIVDQYFNFQDSLDEYVESIEDELLFNPSEKTLEKIQKLRREVIFVRKSIAPVRELLAALIRCDSALIDPKTHIYLGDVYDHSIRVIESLESYRELVSGMIDIYLSSISNKMNAVMKVLTVFASIFIPLTFVAGVYGMNFEYMPELKWRWAYPSLWVFFIFQIIFSLVFFKKKKWF
ncbi:MAG: magnesium/cobalt transporter CorA [Gammaproteobacteria bacterium]